MPVVERPDSARIAWESDGPKDGPAVLLVMGLASPAAMWFRMVPSLAERYRVIRLPGGKLCFSGRVITQDAPGDSELTIEQIVRDGDLEEARVSLHQGDSLLQYEGLWTAESWRMRTTLNGKILQTAKPFRERPLCVEVGSVTLRS